MNNDYKVLPGDSPSKIASKLGVPFADLIAANPGKGTIVSLGVRTWQFLVPGEIIRIPNTSTGLSDVQVTAGHAFDVLSADSNYCESVKYPGTPANIAVHNFKQAWNVANPGHPLPIGTGQYESSVAVALSSVLKHTSLTDMPPGCDTTRIPTSIARNEPKTHVWSGVVAESGVGEDTTAVEFPESYQPALSDLVSLATSAVAALTSDPNRCVSVGHVGSPVNVAVHTFKVAWNAAKPEDKVPVGTGNYEQIVADKLNVLTSGMAPAGCGGGGTRRRHAVPVVAPPPPVVAVVLPPPAPIEEPPPVAPPLVDTSSVAPPPPASVPVVPPPVVQATPAPPAPPPLPPVEQEEYVVQDGDSPEIISRRLGVPFHELIRANPHKTLRHVGRGVHTWHTLKRGERLRVPAHRKKRGQLGLAAVESAGLVSLATVAVAALNADPNHCDSVRRPGSAVNKTVHEFKKAWNAANPEKKVPIGTGKYEQSVADALNTITSGMAPAGCGEKNMPQYHRPMPPAAYRHPEPPRFDRPQPPRLGHRPESPRGQRTAPLYGHRRRPMPPAPPGGWTINNPPPVYITDGGGYDYDDGDVPDAAQPAADTVPAAPPTTPAPATATAPAANTTPAAPSPPPAAPPADVPPPEEKNKKKCEDLEGKEREKCEKERSLSTGAKLGIAAGATVVAGGIVYALAMGGKKSAKKPAGATESRRHRRGR